jgi:hypothetical protein
MVSVLMVNIMTNRRTPRKPAPRFISSRISPGPRERRAAPPSRTARKERPRDPHRPDHPAHAVPFADGCRGAAAAQAYGATALTLSKAPAGYDALGASRHRVGANIRGDVVSHALSAMATE